MIPGSGKLLIDEKSVAATAELGDPSIALNLDEIDADHSLVIANGGGTSVWQYWDGAAWVDYPKSAAGETCIVATVPPSRRIRLNITAGPVIVTVWRRAWQS